MDATPSLVALTPSGDLFDHAKDLFGEAMPSTRLHKQAQWDRQPTKSAEAAIGRCREILDDLREPKTAGLQAAVEATRNLLPKLEADLKALTKAYNTKRTIGAR